MASHLSDDHLRDCFREYCQRRPTQAVAELIAALGGGAAALSLITDCTVDAMAAARKATPAADAPVT